MRRCSNFACQSRCIPAPAPAICLQAPDSLVLTCSMDCFNMKPGHPPSRCSCEPQSWHGGHPVGRRNALLLPEADAGSCFDAGTAGAQQVTDLHRVMSELTALLSKTATRLEAVGWEAMFGKDQRSA